MRALLRFLLASTIAATLAACSDDSLPTSIKPGDADHAFGIIIKNPDPAQFTGITAGDDFTCAVQMGGSVFCWGKSDVYQTGRSGSACWNTGPLCVWRPTQLLKSGGPLLASRIDAGGAHACAIERGTFTAFCWGAANLGQIGINVQQTSAGPTAVPGMNSVSLLSAGTRSTCAQTPSGVSCWGMLNRASSPDNNPTPALALAPVLWTAFAGFVDLSVGDAHGCAIEAAGSFRQVDCWGANQYGQAATQQPGWMSRMFMMPALFGTAVNRVVTQDNTTCVEQADTSVQCSGINSDGIFGDFTSGTQSVTPHTVTSIGQPLHGITVGRSHACGLDPNGFAFCWGNGRSGQLGQGGLASASAPQTVQSAPGTPRRQFRMLAAGGKHTCGVGTDNILYCWGDNSVGQLGAWLPASSVPQATANLQP